MKKRESIIEGGKAEASAMGRDVGSHERYEKTVRRAWNARNDSTFEEMRKVPGLCHRCLASPKSCNVIESDTTPGKYQVRCSECNHVFKGVYDTPGLAFHCYEQGIEPEDIDY